MFLYKDLVLQRHVAASTQHGQRYSSHCYLHMGDLSIWEAEELLLSLVWIIFILYHNLISMNFPKKIFYRHVSEHQLGIKAAGFNRGDSSASRSQCWANLNSLCTVTALVQHPQTQEPGPTVMQGLCTAHFWCITQQKPGLSSVLPSPDRSPPARLLFSVSQRQKIQY